MNKREKFLLTSIVVMVVLIGHFWGAKVLIKRFQSQQASVAELKAKADSYSRSEAMAATIQDEVQWLQEHEPKPSTPQETQSALQSFLTKSAGEIALTPFAPKLYQIEETSGYYHRVKVQISAKGSEEQIYRWLTAIHQPQDFRAVTYLKMEPATDDDQLVVCTIVADQWLVEEVEQ